jgi:hypothetical protein
VPRVWSKNDQRTFQPMGDSATAGPLLCLEERTRDELIHHAQQLKIKGRSRMKKSELVDAIRKSA